MTELQRRSGGNASFAPCDLDCLELARLLIRRHAKLERLPLRQTAEAWRVYIALMNKDVILRAIDGNEPDPFSTLNHLHVPLADSPSTCIAADRGEKAAFEGSESLC
eukprot:CAMPEP_0181231342 /NCGR_PEP_ID=MMETSP1096-20121128/35046_1 /TAXON_ID=156174 ORGANISM="Chrysochromulina ericina, Strain CCMP281" /NCGR_SAMPLE_ID=MMETSP1096 /ASSEMBLY_ACC=CAM_ASM_000453 /LENGTH=106 /DNA_ID=CAMNT_0023325359 /DNA_START=645 /DNA_END=963 /DNA_ORIENTATION=+